MGLLFINHLVSDSSLSGSLARSSSRVRVRLPGSIPASRARCVNPPTVRVRPHGFDSSLSGSLRQYTYSPIPASRVRFQPLGLVVSVHLRSDSGS